MNQGPLHTVEGALDFVFMGKEYQVSNYRL